MSRGEGEPPPVAPGKALASGSDSGGAARRGSREGVSDDSRPGRPVEEGKARRSTTRWARNGRGERVAVSEERPWNVVTVFTLTLCRLPRFRGVNTS